MREEGTEQYKTRRVRASIRRRRERMREEGTEEILAREAAAKRDARRSNSQHVRAMDRRRFASGRSNAQARLLRTPPWLTKLERERLLTFCQNPPEGLQADHVLPFFPPYGSAIAGIHALGNLQYLTPRDNIRKRNKMECTETQALEYVDCGVAVWTKDIDTAGRVNWQPYVGDKLAFFFRPVVAVFGGSAWHVGTLARADDPELHEALQIIGGPLYRWLIGNAGLHSGGYCLVEAGKQENRRLWRITESIT